MHNKHASKKWTSFDNEDEAKNTIATLNSTSGTTGFPKLAARSHYSLVMDSIAVADKRDKPYEVKRLLCTPFFHAFTSPLAIIDALRNGHPTFVMSRFDQAKFLHAVQHFKITETAMPPPMMIKFLAMDMESRRALRNLQLVWSGGAPMAAETQARAVAMFGIGARICQVWGMTEGGWFTTFQYPAADTTGSVGCLLATYEAKYNSQDRRLMKLT